MSPVAPGRHVWVTRAEPGAQATASRLRALGRDPLVGSLLEVRPLPHPAEPPDGVTALAFTSANAVRAFSAWTPRRDWRVFAVGAATAEAALAAGFGDVDCADGDVDALARRIAAAGPGGPVLHPRAREAAGDLAAALQAAGVATEAAVLYETRAAERLPAAVAAALGQGEVEAALLHSPKAGRALAAAWTAAGRPRLDGVRLLGLSAACLAPAAGLPFACAHAASRPTEAAMLELL